MSRLGPIACGLALSAALSLVSAGAAAGDLPAAPEAAARTYTLEQAVTEALANHPRIRASLAEESAAASRIDEAKTARLPDVGVSAQLNRSTGNTVPGAFFSTIGFAPIGGPTRTKSLDEGVWQTGASLWATWDVLSLTRQAAAIDVALASHVEASAATSARRLEIAYRAGDAFIVLLEAQEAVRAAQLSVDRAHVLATVTKALVEQSLRPGADSARADAELASAQTSLARAEQAREMRRALLAEAVGNPALSVDASPNGLLAPVDGIPERSVASLGASPSPSPSHPDLVQSNAAVTRSTEAQRLVSVAYLPRLDLVAAIWARGSGYFQSPAAGLVPDTSNWAGGATLTWSFLDIPTIRARARTAAAARDVAIARRDETYLAVAGELATSTSVLRGALKVAAQTPVTLTAARAAEQQAAARFKTGLTPVVEVADAERVLAQAEIDDALARLEVRRALLLLGRASGDLGPFLAATRGTPRAWRGLGP
jgi:outer membrane protein